MTASNTGRISSFSGNNGTCVEVAVLPDGHIAVRSSTRPHEGTILFTRAEMNAWINNVKAAEPVNLNEVPSSGIY